MSNDDQSPERTRTDKVADWIDTTQELGGSPSRVEAVADAARREGSDQTTGATPSNDELGRNLGLGGILSELEEEMGQVLDNAQSTEPGSPSQRAEGTTTPSEHAEANPDFGIEWPLDGGRSDGGSSDSRDPGADDPGFAPNVGADDFGGVGDSGFTGGDDSGFVGGDESSFTGGDDSGFTGGDESGFFE